MKCLPQGTTGPEEPSACSGCSLLGGLDSAGEKSVSQGALNLRVPQKHLEAVDTRVLGSPQRADPADLRGGPGNVHF